MINLETFFEEKKLPHAEWEITSPSGEMHFIDNQVVINHVLVTHGAERKQICDIIVKIDFANGNVNHFLEHLAHGLVANY